MNVTAVETDASCKSRTVPDANDDSVLRLGNYASCHHPHECYCFQPSYDAQTMDQLRSFHELEKLYENTSETTYDLSLKDIVDPSYTISGNLKATMIAENDPQSNPQEASTSQGVRRGRCYSFMSMKMISLSVLIHGLGSRSERPVSIASPQKQHCAGQETRRSTASKQSSIEEALESRPCSYGAEKDACKTGSQAFAAKSRVHPSNECSACASFTLFFKHHCLVCGRLFCSNCAKRYMEIVADGEKCKALCGDWPLRKRFSRKVANRCWPFSSPYI